MGNNKAELMTPLTTSYIPDVLSREVSHARWHVPLFLNSSTTLARSERIWEDRRTVANGLNHQSFAVVLFHYTGEQFSIDGFFE